jgi:hypothetical protein
MLTFSADGKIKITVLYYLIIKNTSLNEDQRHYILLLAFTKRQRREELVIS